MDQAPFFQGHQPDSDQIEDLTDVEDHTRDRRPHHEVGENGLLSGPGYVAVHQIRTGTDITLDFSGQLETIVDGVEQVEKSDLKGGF